MTRTAEDEVEQLLTRHLQARADRAAVTFTLDDVLARPAAEPERISRRDTSVAPNGSRVALWLVGAAAAVVGVWIAATTMSERAPSVESTTSLGPPPSPAVDEAIDHCFVKLRSALDRLPADVSDRLPDPATAVAELATFVPEPEPTVVLVDGSSVFVCQPGVLGAQNGSGYRASLAADDVVLLSSSWFGPADEGAVDERDRYGEFDDEPVGPGSFSFFGQVGGDIVAVGVELADGTRIEGEVSGGWFRVSGEVPAGVSLLVQQVEWRSSDGAVGSIGVEGG